MRIRFNLGAVQFFDIVLVALMFGMIQAVHGPEWRSILFRALIVLFMIIRIINIIENIEIK